MEYSDCSNCQRLHQEIETLRMRVQELEAKLNPVPIVPKV